MSAEDLTLYDGRYVFTERGLVISGEPTWEVHLDVGSFVRKSVKSSAFWWADWLAYAKTRPDWRDKLTQISGMLGVSEKRARNISLLANIPLEIRDPDVDPSKHELVTSLPPKEQAQWIQAAKDGGLSESELRTKIRASKRRPVVDGQAALDGQYRVVFANPVWPDGTDLALSIADLAALPVASHLQKDAVLFLRVPAKALWSVPTVMAGWGFTPGEQIVVNRVHSYDGRFVQQQHDYIVIGTRGTAVPDRPENRQGSIVVDKMLHTLRDTSIAIYRMIETVWDGPRISLFADLPREDWTCMGSDPSVWYQEQP